MIFSCSISAIFSYNVERFYTLLRLLQLFLRVFYSNQAFFSSRLLDLVLWYTFRLKDNFSSLFYEVFLSRRDHANNNWFQRLAFRLLGTKLYRQITLSVVKARCSLFLLLHFHAPIEALVSVSIIQDVPKSLLVYSSYREMVSVYPVFRSVSISCPFPHLLTWP